MMVEPVLTPVTIPVIDPMVATPVEKQLHVPPREVSARVDVEPTHSDVVPVMVPGSGSIVTVVVI